jgi:hypothetical protein
MMPLASSSRGTPPEHSAESSLSLDTSDRARLAIQGFIVAQAPYTLVRNTFFRRSH